MCFPSCPRHSARLLRACRTHLLRAPQPTVARGAHLASVPGSLHRMHMRTARRHAEQAHAPTLAPTCVVSEPVKVRPATDPACHCLPPPGLLTLVLCVAAPQPDGRPSPSSHTRSSHRPRPARTALPPIPPATASRRLASSHLVVRRRPATQDGSASHHTRSSPRPRPARTPCPYVPLHPKGLASTGSRTCTACALPTRPLSYPSSLLP